MILVVDYIIPGNMSYPRILIDINKLKHNTETCVKLARENDISTIAGVTKVFCAYEPAAKAMMEGGLDFLADSRMENMKRLSELPIEKMFLRLPMPSQAEDVVKYADISLNSEIKTIKALSESAIAQNKVHKIILMIDLGDLREGFYYDHKEIFFNSFEEIVRLQGVKVIGLGTNLTCYGGVIPEKQNLCKLVDFKNQLELKFGVKLEIISGGNSSSVHLLGKEQLPGINNLRLGESIVLGNETAYGQRIENTYDDCFILEAEVIEVKEKPSVPTGKIGLDAFGNVPSYVDRGVRKRVICAVGQQDLDSVNLTPMDKDIIVLGASSDHLILDTTDSGNNYQIGDIIDFKLNYGGLLRAMTSEYVEKITI